MNQKEDFFARKKREIGVSLNEVQQKAVLHTDGPLLLLASPGSGKTTTTIMRIGFLIEEKKVNPARIKAVTFSRASAQDMKQRFQRFFPNQPQNAVDFSTIHSLAFEVVREYLFKTKTPYQIIEGSKSPLQKKQIIKNLFKRLRKETITEDQMEELTTHISFLKNKLIPKKDWDKNPCTVPMGEQLIEEYEKFKQFGTGELLVDYDDMLTIAHEAFTKDAVLLRKYQRRYDYVLTDESQDTSMVQHAIIEKLVQNHKNLYVVADDDQSIYTWRAAEPQYLLNFKQVYPHAKILMMEQNYRSSKDIVDTANQFIKQNKHRYDKNMFTKNPASKPIVIKRFEDYRFQSKYLVQELKKLENYHDAAVLFRNNSSSIILINEFERAGIPFYIKDFDNRFFTHWVVKDILNFMRITFSDRRIDIFEQIHTKMKVYITKEQINEVKKKHNRKSVFETLLQLPNLPGYQAKQIQECKQTFQIMKGMAPLKVIRMIRDVLGYEKTLKKISDKLKFNFDYLMGILFNLEAIADTLATMEEFANRLQHLEAIMSESKFKKNDNVVTLSTFHSSKGLEFKNVYMVDLVDGVIPSIDDQKQADEGNLLPMEESVRLFYVGMTRAEQNLELLSYKNQFGNPVMVSPFVTKVKNIIAPPIKIRRGETDRKETKEHSKIPENPNAIKSITELKIGNRVRHRVFGTGEIMQVNQEMIEIHFSRGIKKLAINLCIGMGLLELVSESALK